MTMGLPASWTFPVMTEKWPFYFSFFSVPAAGMHGVAFGGRGLVDNPFKQAAIAASSAGLNCCFSAFARTRFRGPVDRAEFLPLASVCRFKSAL